MNPPAAPLPPPDEPAPTRLAGTGAAWLGLPALVMALVAAVADVDPAMRRQTWIAAAGALALVAVLASRKPAEVVRAIQRPHYMQALTQVGVFIAWGIYWEPVRDIVPFVLIQLAFAYQVDALVAWWRGERIRLGFGPLPVIFSINLFLWFRPELFAWQLVMVGLCYLAKHVIVWTRDGRRRHIFNPSSFGLAIASFGLLLTGTSHLTLGREIALTQEAAPGFIFALFGLGLIVQLQFRVVLVTAAAAAAVWLLGLFFLRATGVYMFVTTDIPAAVFLGMLLLITDPATSPRGFRAKILFGAAYGALVFASFPFLEDLGSLGYYDKLLPVPLLNLLVPRFERWGAALGNPKIAASPITARDNLRHVAGWTALFGILVVTDAVSPDHPGRDIEFWQRACVDQRFRACRTYFTLLSSECDDGHAAGCHNLGAELYERETQGHPVEGRPARDYFERGCDLGLELSCTALAGLDGGAPVPPPAGSGPPPAPTSETDSFAQRCDADDGDACNALAHFLLQGKGGVARDPARARELFQRGCELDSVASCSSFAALEMQSGEGADTEAARRAFERACDLSDATGCANLAGMYFLGQGVARDPARAAELNDRACGLDLGVACARLSQAYARGEGVQTDPARAAELAARACSLGFAPACAPPGAGTPAPTP